MSTQLSRALVLASSLFALAFAGGCENATRSGNNLMCHGGHCSTSCDDIGTGTPCNVQCEAGSSCDARCNAGQTCNFECQGDARCMFDCSAGSCNANGGADCSCSGDCTGTCGLSAPGTGGETDAGAGGGGVDAGPGGSGNPCIDACGSPSSPGYAACVAACS